MTLESEVSRAVDRNAAMRFSCLVDSDEYTFLIACEFIETTENLINRERQRHESLFDFLLETFVKLNCVDDQQRDMCSHLCARFRKPSSPRRNEPNPIIWKNQKLDWIESVSEKQLSAYFDREHIES